MDLTFLITLLPIVFMVHDFEEIIFFKPWLAANRHHLLQRFPRLAGRLLPFFDHRSTSAFALAVAEEFLLISAITYGSLLFADYHLWFAVFMAFALHLVVHIGQWLLYRRYIPAVVTSLLVLPYCVYTFRAVVRAGLLSQQEMTLWSLLGMALMVLNLWWVHRLAARFDRWALKIAGKQSPNIA